MSEDTADSMLEKYSPLIKCPKCFGPLQKTTTVDSDDEPISETIECKRKYRNKKKKGCGYRSFRKALKGEKL